MASVATIVRGRGRAAAPWLRVAAVANRPSQHFLSGQQAIQRRLAHQVPSGCAPMQASPGGELQNLAPAAARAPAAALDQLVEMLMSSRGEGGALVVSGAGISTASGIADYRSPGRPLYKPMTHQDFVGSEWARKRYWARSMNGYLRLAQAKPNDGHRALAMLQRAGFVGSIITQNVDKLHQRAGSNKVLELHGTIHEIECLKCGGREDRADLQARLEEANPAWIHHAREQLQHRPDGDIDLPRGLNYEDYMVPPCTHCGAETTLKPAVVFHGGSLLPHVRDDATFLSQHAPSLLVVGSTLTVFSSYRIAKEMHKRQRPLAILNMGETRADPLASLLIASDTCGALNALADRLVGHPPLPRRMG